MAAPDVPILTHQGADYALVLKLLRRTVIGVGRLGRFQFPAGWYVYVGSAHGPGGLKARLSRHLRSPKPLHWHLDYLRAHAQPVQVWYAVGKRRRECAWARAVSQLAGASIPVHRFGASDCHCPAHLFHFPARPDANTFARAVEEAISCQRLHVRSTDPIPG
ncbi:MAG TPA: GIY-YIG nuclease family protein [Chloroflexi bacterium]|nr:GIY-YIG nuclease family protein [Chloroflexota bacterium]